MTIDTALWILLFLFILLAFVYLAAKLISFGVLQGKESFEEYKRRRNSKQSS